MNMLSIYKYTCELKISATVGTSLVVRLFINNPLGLKANYIEEKNVHLADVISRVFSSPSPNTSFFNLHKEFPQLKHWKIFHPSPELLSALYFALV